VVVTAPAVAAPAVAVGDALGEESVLDETSGDEDEAGVEAVTLVADVGDASSGGCCGGWGGCCCDCDC
jgi:hypothetical protein